MAESYAAGAASVQFWLGYDLQQIEIGGISIVDYGTAAPPVDPPSYRGQEQDAPWRAAAAERIERILKRPDRHGDGPTATRSRTRPWRCG